MMKHFTPEQEFLQEALMRFLLQALGAEADWVLLYHHPECGDAVLSTLKSTEQLVTVLTSHLIAMEGKVHVETHKVNVTPPS